MQPKLVIGELNDPLEHEADRVADQVMRMPAPELSIAAAPTRLNRKCAACEEEAQLLQTKSADTSEAPPSEAPDIVHEVLRSPGQPLDEPTRAFFEPRFGQSFSDVRVHTHADAGASARAINALAYTVGNDLVFSEGRYSSVAPSGRRLLAHELTHIVQQRSPHQIGASSGLSLIQRAPDSDDSPPAIEHDLPSMPAPVQLNAPAQREPSKRDEELAKRIRSSDLAVNSKPDIIDRGIDGSFALLVWPALTMTGTAEIDPQTDPSLFRFHFYQIGRPFQTARSSYWEFASATGCDPNNPMPVSTTEGIEDDQSEALRAGGPQADTKPGEAWYPIFPAQKITGTRRKPMVPFADDPQEPVAYGALYASADLSERTHIRSVEWTDFFFTAFCVQLPEGTVKPLTSIYWTVRYAEFYKPSCPGAKGVELDGAAKKAVEVGAPMDGAPAEPGIENAGKVVSPTYNEFSQKAPHNIYHGPFRINPPAKID